jgi:hypothetical protein
LPERLSTTYKQYKHDAETIGGWLAENDLLAGYDADNIPTPKAVKLKGRARKLARDDAKGKGKGKVASYRVTDKSQHS